MNYRWGRGHIVFPFMLIIWERCSENWALLKKCLPCFGVSRLTGNLWPRLVCNACFPGLGRYQTGGVAMPGLSGGLGQSRWRFLWLPRASRPAWQQENSAQVSPSVCPSFYFSWRQEDKANHFMSFILVSGPHNCLSAGASFQKLLCRLATHNLPGTVHF